MADDVVNRGTYALWETFIIKFRRPISKIDVVPSILPPDYVSAGDEKEEEDVIDTRSCGPLPDLYTGGIIAR